MNIIEPHHREARETLRSGPTFIVFEGLDGSGKSTAARLTAAALGAMYMTTPSPVVRQYREEIVSSFDGCQEARALFYMSTVFAASREIGDRLARGESIVLDRYFLSTVVYAAFRGSALDLEPLQHRLVAPDMTVYLEAPLATRRARVEVRGASEADLETLSSEADLVLHSAHLERSRLPVVGRFLRVDSSVFAPDEIVTGVLDELAPPHGCYSAR